MLLHALSDVLLKSSSELSLSYQGAEVFAELTLECMFSAQNGSFQSDHF